MKRLTILLAFVATTLFATSALACDGSKSMETASAETAAVTLASTTLKVDGVTCGGCLVPIREQLTALKGIKEIKSGEDVTEVVVVFTDKALEDKVLIEAIKKAGYTASVKGPDKAQT
jgi:copper chaperone